MNVTRFYFALFVLATLGCGASDSPTASDSSAAFEVVDTKLASLRTTSPRASLSAIFARYHNATSYHDRGQVRLSYQVDGRFESKVAPLRIWWDQRRLYLEAYDVHLWSDEQAMTAWIKDDSTNDFDSQVLRVGPIPGRPELVQLLSDPILARKLAAGLAGPPPQLEWLFSPEPLKQLFSETHRFEFGPSRSIDSFPCESIQVNAGPDVYRFWIDKALGIIRQVDLPSIRVPVQDETAQNETAQRRSSQEGATQTMNLSLEMLGASFQETEAAPSMKALPAGAHYVRQFVPLPPPEPPNLLGARAAPFELNSQLDSSANRLRVNERGSDRQITLIHRFSGDERSLISANLLQQWTRQLPESLSSRVRVLVSVDPDAGRAWPSQFELPAAIDHSLAANKSLNLSSGGLVLIDSEGRVVWIQQDITLENLITLGAVITDVIDSVDVPQRLRDQWIEQVRAYRKAIAAVSLRN